MSFRDKKTRGRRRDDYRVDDWLMTYADLITLLLCFFAVLLSVSTIKKENVEQVTQNVRERFAVSDTARGATAPQSGNPQSIATLFRGQGGVAVESGDRYTAIEMNSASFFASGSAELKPDGQRLLATLLPTLQDKRFEEYQITVEGHTDDLTISTAQFPSNWELSTARSAVVVRFFIDNAIPAAKLRAVGYAEVLPKVSNRDPSGAPLPENQAQNRRVVIKLEKIEKN